MNEINNESVNQKDQMNRKAVICKSYSSKRFVDVAILAGLLGCGRVPGFSVPDSKYRYSFGVSHLILA